MKKAVNFSVKTIILIVINFCSFNTSEWTHNSWLDDKHNYHLKWKFDNDINTITFLVEVKTLGWIGFGISPNGQMKGSDIIIGWIDSNQKPYFHDRFAVANSYPEVDSSQDWKLLEWAQNQTHTILQFSRLYKTCDYSNDLEILSQSLTYVIYSYGENDPKYAHSIAKHIEKGSKKLILLKMNFENTFNDEDEDLEYFDFAFNNVTLPNRLSVYMCQVFKVKYPVIRYAIKFSPKITGGNEALVHHLSIWQCGHPDNSKLDKYVSSGAFDCSDSVAMPPDLRYCLRSYFAWTIGQPVFITPPETSFYLGADEETTYFYLQNHYTNFEKVENRSDSSGLRVFHTSKLRPNELSTITVSSTVDYGTVIPPNQPKFIVSAHCTSDCFKKYMSKDGIKLVAALLHTHLIGVKLKLRHFRGNEELPWIFNDERYDFTRQHYKLLKEPLTIKPGDQLTFECTYNSTLRNTTTLGGESSYQEMCAANILYYPRLKKFSQMCLSGLTESTMLSITGLERIEGYASTLDPIIKLPEKLANTSLIQFLTNKKDWSPQTEKLYSHTEQRQVCYWSKDSSQTEPEMLISYPKNLKEYKPIENKCYNK